MKREIRFRAWYNDKMLFKDDGTNFFDSEGAFPDEVIEITQDKGYIWMQYTGLKDKNGKEIYEGDIVKWEENGNYEVVYGYGSNEKTMIGAFCLNGTEMFLHNNDMEIIGNIHENPELLNG